MIGVIVGDWLLREFTLMTNKVIWACLGCYINCNIINKGVQRSGRGAMARAPDCLASHACVQGSIPAVRVWGFQRNIIVSPSAMCPGDHVDGGLIE